MSRVRRSDPAAFASISDSFIRRASELSTFAGLFDLMEGITREIGFDYFALTHHVDLRVPRAGIVNLNNYPHDWRDDFIGRGLFADDPAHWACRFTHRAFAWIELPHIVQMQRRHRAVLDEGARAGLRSGLTVPAVAAGEPNGSCSFATRKASAGSANFILAEIIGTFGFAVARRLSRRRPPPLQVPRLSPRQRDCLVLAGQGKTDWEIGRILGLSPVTVKHYTEDARRVFGVASRMQLVISALLAGEISLAEVAPWQYVHSDV